MTELEQLSKRIEQLAVAIKTGNAAIKSMETALKAAQEERNRFLEQKPKFKRVEKGEIYFTITGELNVIQSIEGGYSIDDNKYNVNNYFHTEERAQKVVDKINFLLRLERLHDTFCPDYAPDWDNYNEGKATVFYHHSKKQYVVQAYSFMKIPTGVYFPTSEIAQKVCDILNKELEEKI